MPDTATAPAKPTTLPALQTQGRNIATPFTLILPDNTCLLCETILRVMPGKRMVVSGNLNGKRVLAKLFFAEKSLRTECEGYSRLQKTTVTTPQQIVTHLLDKGGICLYAFIDNAQALDSLWYSLNPEHKKQHWLQLLTVLGQCYQAGVYQNDLHLGNFLVTPQHFYAIDPASCQTFSSTSTRHDNLALLLAQMPLQEWAWLAEHIIAVFPDMDIGVLLASADKHWQHRKQHYLQKILRDCSDIADLSHTNKRILCRRDYLSPAMTAALENPAALLENSTVLKSGNSATVLSVMIDGKRCVLKRYRNKDIWRTLRRLWRTTRAARCWYFSHALAFAGIHTPAAIALVEIRKHGTVTDAWFITEHIEGQDLLSHWQQQTPTAHEQTLLQQLFAGLKKAGISHGDMKATNVMVSQDNFYLIDFDGTREHSGKKSIDKAISHDIERFLRNWDNTDITTQLKQVLTP